VSVSREQKNKKSAELLNDGKCDITTPAIIVIKKLQQMQGHFALIVAMGDSY
jgi:hypothetical protein